MTIISTRSSTRYFRCNGKAILALIFLVLGIGVATAQAAETPDINKVKISLQLKDRPLKDVLLAIERASDFTFSYNLQEINTAVNVSIIEEDKTVAYMLDKVLKPFRIGFQQIGTSIILKTLPPPKSQSRGSLEGSVYDANTKEQLIGATVILNDMTYATITDIDGSFKFTNLPVGTYQLHATYIGFEKFQVTVIIKEDETTAVNIPLKPQVTGLAEVQVEAKRIVNTSANVLQQRKNSWVVQDGISAETIDQTGSITTTQALQKVTGVSVRDGKHISVRGLTERNIVVQLNGSRLSSADPLRSGAVPLDILPAQLLDNISVQKTVLPNVPGDATGALVELKTQSLPDTLMISVNAQGGWNSNIGPGGDVLLYPNGRLGFFGNRAKDHRLSKEFKELADITNQNHADPNYGYTSLYNKIRDGRNSADAAALALKINKTQEEIDPYLATSTQKATPDQIYSVAVSNMFKVFGQKRLGVLLGVNYYSRSEQIVNGKNNRYQLANVDALTPNNLQLSPLFKFREDAGSHNILYGGVGIITYKINADHALSGHYIHNNGYESSGTLLSSVNRKYSFYQNNANFYSYQLVTQIRNFNTLQLRGEHKIKVAGYSPQISWNYSTSTSKTDLPDFRNALLLADTNGVVLNSTYHTEYYTADVTRYFRYLKEDNKNIIVDLTFPLTNKVIKSSLKTGFWHLKRERNYTESLLLDPTNDPNQQNVNSILSGLNKSLETVRGNLNNWLTPDAIGIAEGASRDGAHFVPGYNYYLVAGTDNNRGSTAYHATQRITALYGMLDVDITESLRLSGGIRVEDTDVRGLEDTTSVGHEVRSYQEFLDRFAVDQQEIQWLPSATLIYKLNEQMNFRIAGSRTLARPEIVELITFSTYDASQFAYISGNNKLENASYDNYDFRWEYFPGLGEVLSGSVFFKRVENALERVFLPSESSAGLIPTSTISFRNNSSAGYAYGIELEAVKSLSFITPSLVNLKVGINATFVKSETKVGTDEYYEMTKYNRTFERERPLFEQPNLVLNTNVSYYWEQHGLATTLYFNKTGKRLVEVNTDGTPSIYEYPSPQLDFVFSKTVMPRMLVKGFVKNILNASNEYIYQDAGDKKGYGIKNETHYRRQFSRGTEYAIGFSYIF